MAHFLAQTGYESNGFKGKSGESGCYTARNADGWKIWFFLTWKEKPFAANYDTSLNRAVHRAKKLKWTALHCNSQNSQCSQVPDEYICTKSGEVHNRRFFSYVYQGEGGNGNSASQDGYRYRGHGAIQLTWKKNYEAFQSWLNNNYRGSSIPNVVQDPTQLDISKELFILSALWFWQENGLNKKVPSNVEDEIAFMKFTRNINTSALDWERRQGYAKSIIDNL